MSKKLFYPICLALVLALAGFAQAELLVNPDFEAGTESWKLWGSGSGSGAGGYWWSSAYGATAIEDGTAQSGNKYIEVGFWPPDGPWWGYVYAFQEHSVTEGKTYQMSAWLRDGDADGAPSLIAGGGTIVWEWRVTAPVGGPDTEDRGDLLDVDGDGVGGNSDKIHHTFDLTEEWTYFSTTEVAPPGANGLSVIFGAPTSYVNVDIDNTSFVELVTILVPNAGFEDPVLVEDDWTWLDVPGWTWVGGEGPGIWNVTSADFDPVIAPEGQNVLYTENAVGDAGGVAQVLTETFAANTDYTLTVEVGNSWTYYWSGYSVQLLAGGTVIAEDNDTLWPDYMLWATSTVQYTYDSADSALVGQPLEIRLLNLGLDKDVAAPSVIGVEFDNVTLTYVAAAATPNVLIENWEATVALDSPGFLATNVENGTYDIGAFSGDMTYEFVVNSNPDEQEASMALIGRLDFGDTRAGIKYEQYENTGTYGATVFGVADHDYGVATKPGVDTHLVFVSSAGETALYVNGVYQASIGAEISLSGVVGIGRAIREDGTFVDNFDGSIFGVAIYDTALSADQIQAHSDAYFMPVPIPTETIEIPIATGSDDAEEDVGGSFAIDLTSTDIELMYDNNPADPLDEQVIGLRFVDVGIPKGSIIMSASVRFDADDVDDPEHVGNAYILIDGELNPNPVTFENTPNNITARLRTTAQVPWISEPWPVSGGTHQKALTADISSIIQEIVDQGGWASGNALVLILSQDPDTPSVGHRECESFNGAGDNIDQRPTLLVEFAPPDEIWREAEYPDVLGASWQVSVDPAASGARYIGSENGDGDDFDFAPGTEWVAIYNFDAVGGDYKILFRGLENDSDSFWVRIPSATSQTVEHPDQPGTGWVRFNGFDAQDTWKWDEVHSDDHGQEVAIWTLDAGAHTLEIAKREDGTYLDGFIITANLGLDQTTLPDLIDPPPTASALNPADGAEGVPIGTTLSWIPGFADATHDVYFGTSSPPAFIANQEATTYYPGRLEPGTTYYWQIDEVAPDGTINMGAVWSFTAGFSNFALDISVATGDDDVEERLQPDRNGDLDMGSSDFEMPYEDFDPLGDLQRAAMRFVNVGIPGGMQVLESYIEFVVDADAPRDNGTELANLIIDAQLTGDAEPFVDEPFNVSNRTFTDTVVPWTAIEPWPTGGETKLTPDISVLVQELVNQADWASGNAMVFTIQDDPCNPSEGIRATESSNGSFAPLLHIAGIVDAATEPSPANGAEGVPITGTIISWWPGFGAVSHDGYIGTTSPPPLLGNTPEISFDPGVLTPSTTYYWQANAVEADGTIHTGDIWSFTTKLGEASQLDPADNALSVALDKTLSWTPGVTAATHDVYFGTTSPPPLIGNQTESSFDPGLLEPGTTYYWQVDEIEADGTTVYTGDVLTFETLTPPPPEWTSLDIDTTGGSTSYDPATGAFTITADGGDIWDNGDRFHFCYQTPTLTRGDCTLIANVASFPLPPNGNRWQKAGLMIRDTLDAGSINAFIAITGGDGDGASFQWRTDTDGGSGSSRNLVVAPPVSVKLVRKDDTFTGYILIDGQWQQEGDSTTLVMGDEVYVGLAVTSHITGSMATAVIDNVSITTPNPNIAAIPDPADGLIEVSKTLTLSWLAGTTAASHDVYISADEQAVIDGTAPVTNVTEASFSPPGLAKGGTYYWRVDEVEADGTTHTGPVWSFTVTTLGR